MSIPRRRIRMLMMHNVHQWNMKSRPAIHDNHNITPFLASSQASATDGNFPLCERSLRDVAACVKKYCHKILPQLVLE